MKREREKRSEDESKKKLKEDRESVVLQALKEKDFSRARKCFASKCKRFSIKTRVR